MLCIYFIAIAFTTVFIYRLGLKDGQKVIRGEKIIDKPIIQKENKEQKHIADAIQKRLEYGVKK